MVNQEALEARQRLEEAEAILMELQRRRRAKPLDYVSWIKPQDVFLRHRGKRKILRTGNQLGKTWAGIAETWWRLTRSHPYRPDLNAKPPPRIIVIGATWPQVNTIQRKLWELCERSQLADGCVFSDRKGAFVGKYPSVRLKNGAVAVFTAAEGDVISIAGDTVDAVWVDEPRIEPRLYGELQKRVMRKGGDIYCTFTPVNAPVGWLRDMIGGQDEKIERGQLPESARIHDLHFRMTPENLVFVDTGKPMTLDDGTECDADWIAIEKAKCIEYEVPVVCDGEWEFRVEGALWKHYRDSGPDTHVVTRAAIEALARDWRVLLGIDHGDDAFASCASLVLASGGRNPDIVILDEWHSDGSTTTEQDAAHILDMVNRNLTGGWADLDAVFGDVPHSGKKRSEGRKSNAQLTAALRLLLGLTRTREPLPTPILPVRKPPGSRTRGFRFIHNAMLKAGAWRVVEACARSRHCLLKFDGRENTPESHQIDAIRYALTNEIEAGAHDSKGRAGPTYVY